MNARRIGSIAASRCGRSVGGVKRTRNPRVFCAVTFCAVTFYAVTFCAVSLLGLIFLAGCALPIDESWRSTPRLPYRTVPPPTSPPPFVHCNDRTGHTAGTTPWIFGGTCLCNPSVEVLADYQASGILSTWAVSTLDVFYAIRGITTLRNHQNCNNLCDNGPHLLKGGRCLVPPTPGTLNWEEIVTGHFALPPWELDRVTALGGPIPPVSPPGSVPEGTTSDPAAAPNVPDNSSEF